MTESKQEKLYRIITIDDSDAILQDFAKILLKAADNNNELDDLEATLLGVEKSTDNSLVFTLDCATQGMEGIIMVEKALAEKRPYALAFVDGRMPPGIDGIETIQELWKRDPALQIVLCTAYTDYSWQEIRNILGETDNLLILKKPFDNIEVLQMAHALTRKWELAREVEGRLHELAFYDTLTGLPNRTMLLDRLSMVLEHARKNHSLMALLFIDMDNFKLVNDSLGHGSGDKLLRVVADRIVYCLRSSDIVGRWIAARLGGDEFIVILPEVTSEEGVATVVQRIVDKVSQPLILDGNSILATPSIGIAIYPQDGETEDELLKNADLAMYEAKRSSKSSAYYQKSMNIRAVKRLNLESLLRQALARNEFSLYYQPQMNLHLGKFSGLEVLLRWYNSTLGQVSPQEFIEVAEETGLIVDIGTWVLYTACAQARTWKDQGLILPRIAVNVSVKQLSQSNFIGVIKNVLTDTGLDPKVLEIEITETLFGENFIDFEKTIQQLNEMDIGVAVDDFGTGYAGVNRFRKISVDHLKIDKSFISEIESSASAQNLIRGIVALADCLNLNVISEGIETQAQLDFLRSINCQQIQGYFYSKPLTVDEAGAFLRNPPAVY